MELPIKELVVQHPYYASDSNYYSNDASITYDTMGDFLAEFGEADIDMNLIYRWDVKKNEDEDDKYYAQIFIIMQRKGIYTPIMVKDFKQKDVAAFVALIQKHKAKLLEIWKPI